MRVVRILVARDECGPVLDVLDDQRIDYVVTEDVRDGTGSVVVEFPLPEQGVELVMDELGEAGLDDRYQVVLEAMSAETTHSPQLEERFVEGGEEDDTIARDEIRTKALELTPHTAAYYAMTVLSAMVATAGLLRGAPSILVGSMVIAPQVGSALTASVGTVLDDRGMIVDGMRSQWLGLAVAVLTAALVGLFVRWAWFVPRTLDVIAIGEVSTLITPGFFTLVVSLAAGVAGALSLATALPSAIVGVMVAAALIPAAATAGIGLAWGNPAVAAGATLTVLLNAVSINLAGSVVLWILDYRPEEWADVRLGATVREFAPMVATVVILVVILLGAGALTADRMAFSTTVNEEVEGVLDDPAYRELTLHDVRTTSTPRLPPGTRPAVTVVVGRPADEPYPLLEERIRERVVAATGHRIDVEVQFVERTWTGDARRPPADGDRVSPLPDGDRVNPLPGGGRAGPPAGDARIAPPTKPPDRPSTGRHSGAG